MNILSTTEAVAAAVAALARAATRDPIAQQIATKSRADRRARNGSRRWRRKVQETTKRLAEADRDEDKEGVLAAILDLHSLGISLEDIAEAHSLSEEIAEG
tara:strand:- start:492 stop:794 length:303 start_codon:yes stop_codon:yes gene_type:complete